MVREMMPSTSWPMLWSRVSASMKLSCSMAIWLLSSRKASSFSWVRFSPFTAIEKNS